MSIVATRRLLRIGIAMASTAHALDPVSSDPSTLFRAEEN
jgi:hypothetical protein